jgi:hypothetical protein
VIYYSLAEPMIFDLCELVCGKLRRDAEHQLSALRAAAPKKRRT